MSPSVTGTEKNMSVRTRRVAGELQRALGEILVREHGDVTDGLMTVTGVDIGPDLHNAKVFVSVLGGAVPAETVIRRLNDRAGDIRSALASKVYMRRLPVLLFVLDASGERVERITRLLNEWHDEQGHDSGTNE